MNISKLRAEVIKHLLARQIGAVGEGNQTLHQKVMTLELYGGGIKSSLG